MRFSRLFEWAGERQRALVSHVPIAVPLATMSAKFNPTSILSSEAYTVGYDFGNRLSLQHNQNFRFNDDNQAKGIIYNMRNNHK